VVEVEDADVKLEAENGTPKIERECNVTFRFVALTKKYLCTPCTLKL
jgi:hypothetical protein